jgi:hypothetical protein
MTVGIEVGKTSAAIEGAKSELATLYHYYRPQLPPLSRWEDERDRWHEPAFAAIAETSGLQIAAARMVTNGLISLRLLDMSALAEAARQDDRVAAMPAISQALRAAGSSDEASRETIIVLTDLALGVGEAFGTLQVVLRQAAEGMLTTLNDSLKTPAIDDTRRGRIFTTWLQNVVEMPLSMTDADQAVLDFTKRHGISVRDLVQIADDADVNVSVVDSVIRLDAELAAAQRS